MTITSQPTIPFVDLAWQHAPLQEAIHGVMSAVIAQGDFVLGQALTETVCAAAAAPALAQQPAPARMDGRQRCPTLAD